MFIPGVASAQKTSKLPICGNRRPVTLARQALSESLAKRQSSGPADEAKRHFVVLAALTKLRPLACHPRQVVKEPTVGSAKLTALGKILGELKEKGHRALVFSQFTSLFDLIDEGKQ